MADLLAAERLLLEALERPPAEQEDFLRAACKGDESLFSIAQAAWRGYRFATQFGEGAQPEAGTTPASAAPTALLTDRPSEECGQMIGQYRLLQFISEGGFGRVWLAERREPFVQRVALKVIKPGMDSRAVVARFEQERQALALMDHPNVARVIDGGITPPAMGSRPYFVMEYVKGEPITRFCDRHRLTIRQRLELFIAVCEAVQHAHMKGIIHRDIKPGNILATMNEGGQESRADSLAVSTADRPLALVKVIDFGIAKAMSPLLTEKTIFTQHGSLVGTPEYMSPEQADSERGDVDTRTDVYSLGVVLYELLTGALPFDTVTLRGAGFDEVRRIIREVEPPRPSTRLSSAEPESGREIARARQTDAAVLAKELRSELEWIPLKAMRKDRRERYRSPGELADDVRNFLAGKPLLAGPVSVGYRARKFLRRNRGLAVAVAAVAVALLVGLATTIVQRNEAVAQRTRANERAQAAETAEAATAARAAELQTILGFQTAMLSRTSEAEAGSILRADVLQRYEAALRSQGVSDEERPQRAAAFAKEWRLVGATDAARALIDAAILRPSLASAEKHFHDQPLLDAHVRQLVADSYRELGLYDAAQPLQERALATRRRLLGDNDPDTIASMGSQGALLVNHDRYEEAEPYWRAVLEWRRRVLGDEHEQTLQAMSEMGEVLVAVGKADEAEACLREGLSKSRRVLGDDHPCTLNCLSAMGLFFHIKSDLEQSEACRRELLERRRRVLGNDHPQTIIAVYSVGGILWDRGRLDEAEPYLREACEADRRMLGEDHARTIFHESGLCGLQLARGDLVEAERLARDVLDRARRVHGADHTVTLGCLTVLSTVLRDQKQIRAAEKCLREALDGYRRSLGPENVITLDTTLGMSGLLIEQQRFADAEALLLPAAAILEAKFAKTHYTRFDVFNALVEVYEGWEKAEPNRGYRAKADLWKAKAIPPGANADPPAVADKK